MPSSDSHLVLRSSTWHCRLDIPAELRPAYGNRRILSKSLKTGDKRLAKELASVVVGQWKAAFRALRDEKLRAGDRWREVVHDEATRLEEARNQMFLRVMQNTSDTPPSMAGRSELIRLLDSLAAEKRHDLLTEFQDLMAEGHTPETKAIWVQRYSKWLDRAVHHRVTAQNLLSETQATEAFDIIKAPKSYKPKTPISTSAIERFEVSHSEQNDNVRTRDVYLSKIKAFSKWLTVNGKELNFDSVAEYLDSVSSMANTRKGYLAALSKFHKWAIRYEPYYRELLADRPNPFIGHDHPRVGKNAGDSYVPFQTEELVQLHNVATAKGDTDLADLIQFAAFTGCRIEEIGRIRLETTMFDESGQPIGFKVDTSKTKAGIREVPIHTDLLPLYQKRLNSPYGDRLYLFKGNDKQKHDLRLSGISQRFTKLKRSEGYSDLHVFHSIRKTMITQLQQTGVTPLTVANLVGHETGMITFDTYSAGASWAQLQDAINNLKFEFN